MATMARLLRRETGNALRCTLRARFPFTEKLPEDHFQRTLATDTSLGQSAFSTPISQSPRRRRVAVFWDLDNKPPRLVRPFDAATRLKAMAAAFGEVVDVVAYANHHAFEHVPSWIHDERRQRKELDRLEASGAVQPGQPYVCGVCGAKKKTHVLLTKHFKSLHEREHKKRVNRLDSLRGKKKQKERFREANSEKMAKYREAAESVLVPKVGYGLMQEIRRAGVYVRTVKDEPQAADIALKDHIRGSMKKGVKCICLVSDDTDFKPDLNFAREKNLHVVVVGDLKILSPYADTYFSWRDVASGRAEEEARRLNGKESLGELGSSSSSVSLGCSEVLVENESDWGSDDDEDWGGDHWQPIDKNADSKLDGDQDYVSDSLSESDTDEASEGEKGGRALHRFQQHCPKATRGRGMVRIGFRTLTTNSKAEQDIPNPPEIEGEAISAEHSEPQNPQRLHSFFTRLEAARSGRADSSKGKLSLNGESDPRHVTRVHDILKSAIDELQTTSGRVTPKYEERSRQSVIKAEGASEWSSPSGEGRLSEGPGKLETSSSAADGESGSEDCSKSKRRLTRRGPAMKPRVVKVVRSGPMPFYLSGFASESQSSCNAITRYHKEWWRDDGEDKRKPKKRPGK